MRLVKREPREPQGNMDYVVILRLFSGETK